MQAAKFGVGSKSFGHTSQKFQKHDITLQEQEFGRLGVLLFYFFVLEL